MKGINRRILTIFLASLIIAIAFLYIINDIHIHVIHQQMVQYSRASSRADGAGNRVVMLGTPGYLGESSVRLSYLKDGYIRLSGDNPNESNGWKLLAEFSLEPGTYTLTGLSGQHENTVALQLHIEDSTGFYRYFYQYDEDVMFTVEREVEAVLHARVYPGIGEIDVVVRPAVYKEGGAI